ncbi:dolichol-phosphate mannosyltransferase [Plasmodium falciparum HB3]|uniref:Dolichol-phosphate mannosyltransferase subunit 1 n=1 Tax=Plasmodium falciparum (isolate HB3) TaxID=137071 RepID=A0A0L7KAV3_PLAFX|nr:dolichol-phosphate mannosyltransferase [Plasmodium falciparum HB3]
MGGCNFKYSIILPTYNEKENLPYLIYMIIDELNKHEIKFEIIVIDDNSQDGTADVYKKKGKLGLGSAYMEGLKNVTGDFVIIMDADLSHHPKYIYNFIKKQREKNCDIVTGTRYKNQGGISGWSFNRIIISRVANFLAQFLLFINLSDLTGSFRLYKTNVLKELMQSINNTGYVFQMEVLVRAYKMGKSIEEVGYVFVDRLFGKSKLETTDILQYLSGLFKLFWSI